VLRRETSHLAVLGVIDSLLNGLGFVKVAGDSSIAVFRNRSCCMSVVEEVTVVSLVYVSNNSSSVLGYGFEHFRQLLRL
jgi:hypothetical protein